MACLKIVSVGKTRLCLLAGVPMPDGTRRDYAEFGRDGLRRIFERIRYERKNLFRREASNAQNRLA